MKKLLLPLMLTALLAGCVGRPDNIVPVTNFNTTKYLGKWYEIARLDHSFERGLSHVTADYSLRQDGGLKVSTVATRMRTPSGKNPKARPILSTRKTKAF